MTKVRPSAIAGIFYPGNADDLTTEICTFLATSQKISQKPPKFLIVPHAGYVYSGRITASGYKEVYGESYDQIFMLGPSHRHYFQGIIQSGQEFWETPLGNAPIYTASINGIQTNLGYHANEHCLEIQIPFIQHCLPNTVVAPFLLSGPIDTADQLSDILLELDSPKTLWVISSDFSHTGSNFSYDPQKYGYHDGEALDRAAAQIIERQDKTEFKRFLQQTKATICGALPILVSMLMVDKTGRRNYQFKAYDCSGNQTNDINSVGYATLYS